MKKNLTRSVTILLSPRMYADVVNKAKSVGSTPSTLIRMCIEKQLTSAGDEVFALKMEECAPTEAEKEDFIRWQDEVVGSQTDIRQRPLGRFGKGGKNLPARI